MVRAAPEHAAARETVTPGRRQETSGVPPVSQFEDQPQREGVVEGEGGGCVVVGR